jgi:hypothetical protein
VASGRVVLEHLPFPRGALVIVLVVDQRTELEEVENWRALHFLGRLLDSKTWPGDHIFVAGAIRTVQNPCNARLPPHETAMYSTNVRDVKKDPRRALR